MNGKDAATSAALGKGTTRQLPWARGPGCGKLAPGE